MGTLFRKRPIRYPLLILSLLGIAGIVICVMWNLLTGAVYGIVLVLVLILTWKAESETYKETERHIEMLSYRLKKVGEEALLEMPIGIVLIDDQFLIEWTNPYMLRILGTDSLIGEELLFI